MSHIHSELAEGRWRELSLVEQMANIGSEVHRTINWHNKKDDQRFNNAFDRALELFDLTLADPRWNSGRKEIARCREVFCDIYFGNNSYNVIPESLDEYFLQFGIAARLNKLKR